MWTVNEKLGSKKVAEKLFLTGTAPPSSDKAQYEAGELIDEENCICSATISIPLSAPKVLMLELAELIAAKTMLRHTPGDPDCLIENLE